MIPRRQFLFSLSATLLAARSLPAAARTPAPKKIYIGTGGHDTGILTADWNAATGEIGPIERAAEVVSPTFLAQFRRPDGETCLYAVTETKRPEARVSAFTTVRGQKTLKLLNYVDTGGDGPTHVSVSPDGRTVLVANYGSGSVSSFRVLADGSLSPVVSHFQFTGSGPYQGRQEAPHTHSAVTSPDGRFVLVNDLGLDRIMVFHLNSSTAEMTPADPLYWSARPGTGPRHLAWSPKGKFVYGSNELDSTVETLAWSEHPAMLRSLGFVSSLPPGFPPNTAFVGEIIASADGRNVYAGNRVADDTIAVFDVNRRTGLLQQTQLAPSGGQNARHIALDPSGQWMVVSHQNSNDLTVLKRDRKTGKLSAPVHTYPAAKPMCVLFV
ncbi:lactonase family protein [soil metagenome]